MSKEARDKYREVWQERINAQVASGKSIAEWCAENGVKESTFGWWKKRLMKPDDKSSTPEFVEVPVGPIGSATRTPFAVIRSKGLEIELYSGVNTEAAIKAIIEVLKC